MFFQATYSLTHLLTMYFYIFGFLEAENFIIIYIIYYIYIIYIIII
jgi:hypothetical protein